MSPELGGPPPSPTITAAWKRVPRSTTDITDITLYFQHLDDEHVQGHGFIELVLLGILTGEGLSGTFLASQVAQRKFFKARMALAAAPAVLKSLCLAEGGACPVMWCSVVADVPLVC